MNAVSLLCEIISQNGKVAAQNYREDVRYGALLDAGLLKRDGLVQSLLCENCEMPHDAAIEYEAGSYGYYCPELGFVPLERAELVAMRPDLEALLDQLGVALGCGLRSTLQLGPQTWRVGLVDTAGGQAAIYLHPRLVSGDDLDALDSALRAEIRHDFTLILTAFGTLPYRSATVMKLTQILDLNADAAYMTARASVDQAVGAPSRRTGGRPNLHGQRIQSLLSERAQRGRAKEGRNEEAKAVLAAYVAQYPHDLAPKLPTVKGYVTKFRSGCKLDKN